MPRSTRNSLWNYGQLIKSRHKRELKQTEQSKMAKSAARIGRKSNSIINIAYILGLAAIDIDLKFGKF